MQHRAWQQSRPVDPNLTSRAGPGDKGAEPALLCALPVSLSVTAASLQGSTQALAHHLSYYARMSNTNLQRPPSFACEVLRQLSVPSWWSFEAQDRQLRDV